MSKTSYTYLRASLLFKELEALCPYKLTQRRDGRGNLLGYKALAVREADLLMKQYPDTSPEPERYYNAAYGRIAALKNEMLQMRKDGLLEDHAHNGSIKTLITNFTEQLYTHFSVYRKRYNDNYREAVKVRTAKENRIEIEPEYFLDKAKLVLSYIPEDNKEELNWKDVSCAIALCTGRRMGEIHLSGEFKQLDDYQLSFKGQLKGKSRTEGGSLLRDVLFEIPTLIPANLIIDGINWLDAKGKRLDPREYKPKDVNNRYSKYLSERCKALWSIIDYEGMRYHNFRKAYGICASHNFVNETGSILDAFDYLTDILGDQDVSTLRAYNLFKVAPGQKTKL